MIFDERARIHNRPMRESEGAFEYYSESSRPEIEELRSAINSWSSHLQLEEIRVLKTRMAASTDEFNSCELELAVHEWLRRREYHVGIHPELPNGRKTDFLATRDNVVLYAEVTALFESSEETGEGKRIGKIVDSINEIEMPPGHHLGFSVESTGRGSPSIRRIKRELQRWILGQSPANTTEFPKTVFEIDEWVFEATLFNSGSDRKTDRAIGALFGGVRMGSPKEGLKASLERKSKRYGKLNKPMIIALADYRMLDLEEDDLREALYGEWATTINRQGETGRRFLRNGFFGHGDRPQHQNVSAVARFPCHPFWASKSNKAPSLYLNPFAEFPLEFANLGLRTIYLENDGSVTVVEGEQLKQLLFD